MLHDDPMLPIGEALNKVYEEAQALREDVSIAEVARRRANQINLALLGVLALFVAAVLAVAWQNNTIAAQTRNTNARMADCTTPGGKCYNQGSERTRGAINSVIDTQIAALQCARLYPGIAGPEYDARLEGCVRERVAGLAKIRAATPTPAPSASPSGR